MSYTVHLVLYSIPVPSYLCKAAQNFRLCCRFPRGCHHNLYCKEHGFVYLVGEAGALERRTLKSRFHTPRACYQTNGNLTYHVQLVPRISKVLYDSKNKLWPFSEEL